MSSLLNPDVDRISLDQRLNNLQDNCGSGPVDPGVNTGTTVIKNAIDFDQYPDNGFTISDKGIIFKVSIDNTTPGSTFPAGMDFKMCVCLPTLHQFIIPGNITPIIIARLKLENHLANNISFMLTQSLNNQPFIDYCNGDTNFSLLRLFFGSSSLPRIFAYSNIQNTPFEAEVQNQTDNRDGSIFTIDYNVMVNSFKITKNPDSTIQNNSGVYYGAFQRCILNTRDNWVFSGYTVLGGNLGYGIIVNQPNDLPNWYRQIYPQSWYA